RADRGAARNVHGRSHARARRRYHHPPPAPQRPPHRIDLPLPQLGLGRHLHPPRHRRRRWRPRPRPVPRPVGTAPSKTLAELTQIYGLTTVAEAIRRAVLLSSARILTRCWAT